MVTASAAITAGLINPRIPPPCSGHSTPSLCAMTRSILSSSLCGARRRKRRKPSRAVSPEQDHGIVACRNQGQIYLSVAVEVSRDRKSVGEGKRVGLGGRRII